jgi:hypothetical protein
MENFQQFFASLSSTEQQSLVKELATISRAKSSNTGNQLQVKRELESPETPFLGKGRKVSTNLRCLIIRLVFLNTKPLLKMTLSTQSSIRLLVPIVSAILMVSSYCT